ncbi:hypothetical protein BC939DRAFT_103922 [Gamsiella multidivaricata]|uniref:uncharacterized protein n=1 Tax=Gamsiella multidivaricata TaxID=101098 RepID=UPI00221F6CD9|nr:uncharacterized protein BC939DRAFT_103922 [Gamsiella multidivaricata]KAI7832440.1 hypothetical protein BC939DRAFT_103922 [Gamsiella multidivaricata]
MSGAGTGPAIAPSANIPQPPLNQHQLLHSYRPPGHLTQPYLLEQVKDVQNHTAQAIFRLEDYWTSGSDRLLTGGAQEKQEGSEKQGGGGGEEKKTRARMSKADINEVTRPLKTLLELMQRHLRAGIEAMARPRKEKLYPFRVCDPKIFSPALNEDFVIEFYIRDSQLVCAAYALQLTGGPTNGSSGSGGNVLTSYLQHTLPGGSSTTITQHQQGQSVSSAAVSSTDVHHHITHAPQQNAGHGGGDKGGKSGQGTPRPASPVHHHTMSLQPSHQHHGQQQQGGKGHPWSPARSPSTTQQPHHLGGEFHSSAPTNDTVVLPASNKIGQTSKGGINKYRGKVATTLEDKVVQVQSSKLEEINGRLVHAEGLCRRLLYFLVLQESVAEPPV